MIRVYLLKICNLANPYGGTPEKECVKPVDSYCFGGNLLSSFAMTTTRIFVKNVASSTTEDDMAEAFGKFGPIRKIDLKPGYSFLFYEDARDADVAIREMNGQELNGKKLLVEMAIDSKSAQRERDGKPAKRLDLRISVTGMDTRLSWQDLKDWARAAGDVTFANVFVRDGQPTGVVEFFDEQGLNNALNTLEGIPLNGANVRVAKVGTYVEYMWVLLMWLGL